MANALLFPPFLQSAAHEYIFPSPLTPPPLSVSLSRMWRLQTREVGEDETIKLKGQTCLSDPGERRKREDKERAGKDHTFLPPHPQEGCCCYFLITRVRFQSEALISGDEDAPGPPHPHLEQDGAAHFNLAAVSG